MPVSDTTSVVGGPNQSIVDWYYGDDRQFSGDVQLSPAPPPVGDLNLKAAYFTLKLNPNDTDANALIQKRIAQTGTAVGQITTGLGGFFTQLLIKVSSGDYQNVTGISVGPSYWWDFRAITASGGVSFTVAEGRVRFVQNVTRTDNASQPATFPNSGNPQFRGFRYISPQFDSTYTTYSNIGDLVFNQIPPSSGNGPVGWQCIGAGIPGIWVAFGTTSVTSFVPVTNWTFGSAPPASGTHAQGDIVWNIFPTSGLGNSPVVGWACVAGGTPGTWKQFGALGI